MEGLMESFSVGNRAWHTKGILSNHLLNEIINLGFERIGINQKEGRVF